MMSNGTEAYRPVIRKQIEELAMRATTINLRTLRSQLYQQRPEWVRTSMSLDRLWREEVYARVPIEERPRGRRASRTGDVESGI